MSAALAVVWALGRPGWDAPPQCGDANAVVERVEALAGRGVGDELETHARVEGPPWRATIELRRGDAIDTRVVEAESCVGLVDAYAVMIAVALDPIAVVRQAATGEGAATLELTPTETETDSGQRETATDRGDRQTGTLRAPRSASSASRSRTAVHRLGVRVGGGAGVGGWDRSTGAVELAFAWSRNAFELDVVGRYWIRRRDALDDGGAVRVELGTIGVLACWVGTRTRWSLAGCAGIEAGDLVIEGVRAPARDRVHFPWVAPLVGVRGAVRATGPLSIWLGLEAAIPVARLEAVLDGPDPVRVYEAGSPAVRALAGIELRWTIRGKP
ncbi:MAG TPA: hypothetical protein VG755_14050 [Nannocystaceae bacterium]|nr:hypothetical protein [Nannocystaceae bacterium]